LEDIVESLYDDYAIDYEMYFGVNEYHFDDTHDDLFANSSFEVGSTSRFNVGDKRKISDVLDEVDEEVLVVSESVSRVRKV